jgi:hypothetical protein
LNRFLIRVSPFWNARGSSRPIVFIPGLGLGLIQYYPFLTDLLTTLPDRPLLILIQPHINQNVFHPRFLHPMGRHETAKCLIGLMSELGWVEGKTNGSESEEKEEIRVDFQYGDMEGHVQQGVTMLSHSK